MKLSKKDNKVILITGVLGLIGSAVADYFLNRGFVVVGVDNNMRGRFFGKSATVVSVLKHYKGNNSFMYHNLDIRNDSALERIFQEYTFDAIIHTAAQPSHDFAKDAALLDFDINARATLQLLELTRKYQPNTTFIFTSTNKVYGSRPNDLDLKESEWRFEPRDETFKGFNEEISLDCTTHSLFGASKLSADIYVQEYGRYFGIKTVLFRLGCVTGENHASVTQHGFLHYLIKSVVTGTPYTIFGYKGKQVRDQIHAMDVARAFFYVLQGKVEPGSVYNLGGGRDNSASILELLNTLKHTHNSQTKVKTVPKPRVGDHIYYVTDFAKFQSEYPGWSITIPLSESIDRIVKHEQQQLVTRN
jgi:CDP-paratose 2-epimerase